MLPLTEIMRICSATSRRHGDDVSGGGPELKIHSIPCIWLGSFQEKDEDLLDAKSPVPGRSAAAQTLLRSQSHKQSAPNY
jgi:hypothetical protein